MFKQFDPFRQESGDIKISDQLIFKHCPNRSMESISFLYPLDCLIQIDRIHACGAISLAKNTTNVTDFISITRNEQRKSTDSHCQLDICLKLIVCLMGRSFVWKLVENLLKIEVFTSWFINRAEWMMIMKANYRVNGYDFQRVHFGSAHALFCISIIRFKFKWKMNWARKSG